jgi:protein gp37
MRLILGEYYHSIGIEHLPNVWCGVSVHDNDAACSLIPLLLEVPAAVRFLSVEPMLGPVDLRPWLGRIDWVICGPETGPGARPFDPAWAKAFYGQCREAGVPFFLKRRTIDGREVREFPRGGK